MYAPIPIAPASTGAIQIALVNAPAISNADASIGRILPPTTQVLELANPRKVAPARADTTPVLKRVTPMGSRCQGLYSCSG